MVTRREYLKLSLAAGAALAVGPRLLLANPARRGELITRAIPSSGERIPVVGLGSSATFAEVARSEDVSALRATRWTIATSRKRSCRSPRNAARR
jgi:hypothetical protein